MHHPTSRVFTGAGAGAVLLVGLAALAGQTPSPPTPQDQPRPTFRTEANFVRVDVYPTRGGKPVSDLRKEDFEVLEDGRPQSIETFEYIRIETGGPRSALTDPNSIEAMRQAAANPRSRVFVFFLDAYHVTFEGAKNIGPALIKFIERALAPDDLVGVMTPWMSPADVVLARKTQVLEAGLRNASWGRRFTPEEDEREGIYKDCYRVLKQETEQGKSVSDLARGLTLRRREVLTLESLRELVLYLRGVREERKALLVVTEGWLLFRPDPQITRLREECTCPTGMPRRELQDCTGCSPWPPPPLGPWKEAVPGNEPIRVGPDGRLGVGSGRTESGLFSLDQCSGDRVRLANIDNQRAALDLANDANRANASFYTIDPRGLAAFDTPLSRDADEVGVMPSVAADQRSLMNRHSAMANLAIATDGIAITNSNDLDAGLRRIADDLRAYYLLGYYTANAKLDGKYHTISVRVKQPGIDVRARPGYRAPTAAEVAAARKAVDAPVPESLSAVSAAIGTLARIRPSDRFRMHAIPLAGEGSNPAATVWVAGELPAGSAEWGRGASASIEVARGGAAQRATVTVKPGERAFLTEVPVPDGTGPIEVRGRLSNADAAVMPFSETLRLDVAAGALPQALLFRRGPATGNRLQPVAGFLFARSDVARLELPLRADMKPGSGRLLDRAGQELKIPVTIGERTDAAAARRWLTADVVLAALGAGDYAVEVSARSAVEEQKMLTAIRVTR